FGQAPAWLVLFVGWAKSSARPPTRGHRASTILPTRTRIAGATPTLLFALVVIMDLVQHTAAIRLERPVMDAGWPARIGRRIERLAALAFVVVADDQVAGDQINFFPVIVHEGCRGVDAGREAQQPRAAARLFGFVEIARQDFLLDAGRVAGRRHPALVHVDLVEFEMRLVHRHRFSSLSIIRAPAGSGCRSDAGFSAPAPDRRARLRKHPTAARRLWPTACRRTSACLRPARFCRRISRSD